MKKIRNHGWIVKATNLDWEQKEASDDEFLALRKEIACIHGIPIEEAGPRMRIASWSPIPRKDLIQNHFWGNLVYR